MSEVWGVLTAAVISAGAAAYSANQQKKAAAAQAAALGGAQQLPTTKVPFPSLVDAGKAQQQSLGYNGGALQKDFELANQVNNFQLGQALRGYNRIQPYFSQLQAQIGRNALSFAKGELPSDVVSSIGRAAAERGFANGLAGGANGAGAGTALGSLNLRNLGLSSLQLSQQGSQLGMALNSQAGALAPALFDVSSQFVTPAIALAAQQFNAGAINQTNQLNAGYANAANTQNVGLANALLQQQSQNQLASSIQQSNAYASAANSLAGLAASQFGSGSSSGGNFYGTAAAAQRQIPAGSGATVTSSPYGYAIRPATV